LASSRGGGIDNRGSLTMTGCTLSGNSASVLFGGGIYNCGTLTIANCTLSRNSAIGSNGYGGGIHSTSGTLTINDSTLSANAALYGGGVYMSSGTLTHCTLSGNQATGGRGGGVYTDSGTTTITDSTLEENTATGGGGGIANGGTLSITNSVVSGNSSTGDPGIAYGGGISNSGTLTITASTLSGNSAASGGGISTGGTLTVTDSTLSGNAAIGGGGIFNNSGTVTIIHSTLSGNAATSGGGICNFNFNDGTLTITASTLSGNSASSGGGGIYINSGTTTIADSTLSGNSATKQGGGIEHYYSSLTITNSTLSANSTSGYGGGIYDQWGNLTLTNSTVSANSASGYGGGIYGGGALTNSIVAGNAAGYSNDLSGAFGVSYCLIQDTTDVWIAPEVNLLGQPALLGPLGYYGGPTQTLPLLPGSPAIDAGGNDLIPTGVVHDQRGQGYLRIVNGTVDIGAFEVGSSSFVLAPASGVYSGTTTLSAALTVDSVPIPGQTITFSTAGQTLGTATTNSQGVATLSDVSLAGFDAGVRETGAAIGSGSIIATATLTITPATTNVVVTSSPNPAVSDQPVTLTATVSAAAPASATPGGTVTFLEGSAVLGTSTLDNAGRAALSTSSLALGNHTITVQYDGNANFAAASGSVTQVVDVGNRVLFDEPTGVVVVLGGSAADTIVLAPAGKGATATLQVTLNRAVISKTIPLSSIQQIRVLGQMANDTITVSNLNKPISAEGCDGDDTVTLTNLSGPVTVDGGAGTDKLIVTGRSTVNAFSLGTAALTVNGVVADFSNLESLAVNGARAADTLTVVALPAFPVTFMGGGGSDKLQGPNAVNGWAITAANKGTLDSTLSFAAIPNLTGGSNDDRFTFSPGAKLAGNIDGGGGIADAIDYANYGAAVTVKLQTLTATGTAGLANVESFVGSAKADTLIGLNQANQWNITGANTGTVNGTAFAGFENLTGGTGADTFSITNNGTVSGKIDGGKGTTAINYLIGPDQPNVWALLGSNAGRLNATAFANIQNLTGGAQGDAFVFAKRAKVSGRIDGGGGRNRLDYSAYTTSVTVDLSAGTATGTAGIAKIQAVTGGTAADQLTGNAEDNILIGGGGNDTLIGNDGRDLLFGGDGLDTIRGGPGEDLIISGKTTFDANWTVLDALLNYWRGPDGFGVRTDNLAAGTTGDPALPKLDSTTITNDNFVDDLMGGADADWYFAKTADPKKDLYDLLAEDRVN
jgi:hypothetical protein